MPLISLHTMSSSRSTDGAVTAQISTAPMLTLLPPPPAHITIGTTSIPHLTQDEYLARLGSRLNRISKGRTPPSLSESDNTTPFSSMAPTFVPDSAAEPGFNGTNRFEPALMTETFDDVIQGMSSSRTLNNKQYDEFKCKTKRASEDEDDNFDVDVDDYDYEGVPQEGQATSQAEELVMRASLLDFASPECEEDLATRDDVGEDEEREHVQFNLRCDVREDDGTFDESATDGNDESDARSSLVSPSTDDARSSPSHGLPNPRSSTHDGQCTCCEGFRCCLCPQYHSMAECWADIVHLFCFPLRGVVAHDE
eukprot:TRINITY_DN2950_c0_g1_i1.p1 TRINITY_DN2950_c0_g1~~TRINITY_DN2950_c0_g1_i1.p1  ORF type:complete len:310 (+),score=49.74 TRINITY_DN2950_c0_g1_i1:1542-2471(+)